MSGRAAAIALLVLITCASNGRAGDIEQALVSAATRHRISPRLVAAVMAVESGGNPAALSAAGAQGLMQLMPATARRFGVQDPFDIHESLDGGCAYLSWLANYFDQDLVKVLAAYNAGEANVTKYGGVPPFPETEGYVRKILKRLGQEKAPAKPRPEMRLATFRVGSSVVALAPRVVTPGMESRAGASNSAIVIAPSR